MIGKLVLGTVKDSSIPVILKETGPELYVEKAINEQGNIVNAGTSIIDTSNATGIGTCALMYAYRYNTTISGNVDFSTITNIESNGCDNTFRHCTNITSVNLSSLTTIGDYGCRSMFIECSGLTNVDLSSLQSITQQYACAYMFYQAGNNATIDLSELKTINSESACYQMFYNSNFQNITLSNIETINGSSACFQMFYRSKASTVDLSKLETINGSSACYQMFYQSVTPSNIDLSSLSTIRGTSACSSMFNNCSSVTSVDLSSLTTICNSSSCNGMFQNCTNLTTVDLKSLTRFGVMEESISSENSMSYMFNGCTNLENIDLSSLENFTFNYNATSEYISWNWGVPGSYVFGYSGIKNNPFTNVSYAFGFPRCFYYCSKLEDGTFPKLVYIGGNYGDICVQMFYNCTNMAKCDFPALTRLFYTNVFDNAFYGCASLTDIHFPMLKVFHSTNNPFSTTSFKTGSTPTITVHFRKDAQTKIESLSDYATLWGASSIVFDQIGTITVDGNDYSRIGYCNKPGYIAWIKNGSNVTANGNTYNFLNNSVGYFYRYEDTDVVRGAAYELYDSNNSVYAYTYTPDLKVGDYIYSSKKITAPDLEVTASTVEIIYTSDSAEPDVGDTAYSDISGTVLGTISAVA